jgi:hypothetical protein
MLPLREFRSDGQRYEILGDGERRSGAYFLYVSI